VLAKAVRHLDVASPYDDFHDPPLRWTGPGCPGRLGLGTELFSHHER
jgi:hypothetical protein